MVEHHCAGVWIDGPVIVCPHHIRQGQVRDVRPFNVRNNVVVEGIAKTGQMSQKGTVKHREWYDGHVDAKASVRPISMKVSELRRLSNERRSG